MRIMGEEEPQSRKRGHAVTAVESRRLVLDRAEGVSSEVCVQEGPRGSLSYKFTEATYNSGEKAVGTPNGNGKVLRNVWGSRKCVVLFHLFVTSAPGCEHCHHPR